MVFWGKIVLDLDPSGEQMQTIALAHLAYGLVLGVLAAAVPICSEAGAVGNVLYGIADMSHRCVRRVAGSGPPRPRATRPRADRRDRGSDSPISLPSSRPYCRFELAR